MSPTGHGAPRGQIIHETRDYQPGNGTCYDLLIVEQVNRYVLVWVGHGAMALYGGDVPMPRYLQEKLGGYEGDAIAIAEWLRSIGWGQP